MAKVIERTVTGNGVSYVLECDYCGEHFHRAGCKVQPHKNAFCSRECNASYHRGLDTQKIADRSKRIGNTYLDLMRSGASEERARQMVLEEYSISDERFGQVMNAFLPWHVKRAAKKNGAKIREQYSKIVKVTKKRPEILEKYA